MVASDCPDCGETLANPNACSCGWLNEETHGAKTKAICIEDGCNRPTHGPAFVRCTDCLGKISFLKFQAELDARKRANENN